MWLILVFLLYFGNDCECLRFKNKGENQEYSGGYGQPTRPHIVVVLADDLGFNDVSYRTSSEFLTPNIDAIGYQGIILNRYYVSDMCSPSRAALLTGRYPVNIGMQNFAIANCDPYGLPLDLKILPQYLKEAGYRTHLVGKWHQGYFRKAYTPTERGFDTFFGFYTGTLDYFTHESPEFNITGYDFRRNSDVTYEGLGEYSTFLFTNESIRIIQDHNPNDPLFLMVSYNAPHASNSQQAPQEEVDKIDYILDPDPQTRVYASLLATIDRGVGQIVSQLSRKGMLSNSVILFYSDNGAPALGLFATKGSNYPFRGQKYSPWEGGVRVPGVFWSPAAIRHRVSNHLIHTTDWLPTFLALAGIHPTQPVDGFNIWPTLSKAQPSPRNEMIHNINPVEGWSSFYYKGWKYINGTTSDGTYDSWYGRRAQYQLFSNRYSDAVKSSDAWKALAPFAQRTLTKRRLKKLRQSARIECQSSPFAISCNPLDGPCLFRINEDPCEMNNLATIYPFQTYVMQILVNKRQSRSITPINQPWDYEGCNPINFNGTYTWWYDVADQVDNKK